MRHACRFAASVLRVTCVTCVAWVVWAAAQPVFAAGVGEVAQLNGTLFAKRLNGTTVVLGTRSALERGDTLMTGAETTARLRFVDNTEVLMRANSQLRVTFFAYKEDKPEDDSAILSLLKGGLRTITGLIAKRNAPKVQLNTSVATIGVRGTEFGALLCQAGDCANLFTENGQPAQDGLHTDVASGEITVTNGAGTQVFSPGQFGFVPDFATLPAAVESGVSHKAIPPLPPAPTEIRGSSGAAPAPGTGREAECEVP